MRTTDHLLANTRTGVGICNGAATDTSAGVRTATGWPAALLAILACGAAAATIRAAEHREDFENDTVPGQPGFAASLFTHNIGVNEYLGRGGNWDFWNDYYVSPGWSLFLGIATDYVTLRLPAGETAQSASVWCIGWGAPAYLHVMGTAGEVTRTSSPGGTWEFLNTSGVDVGQIVEIRLTATEGSFDDLRIVTRGSCPGDWNGDGRVDQADLGILLADWGCTRSPGACPGDLDGDGDTDQADLGLLLARWGQSCL